jgi:ABC-type transporter Mla subunit MlaD
MSSTLNDGVKALTAALEQLKKLDTEIAGKQAHIARLQANADELFAKNQQVANDLAEANNKIAAARRQADEIVAEARTRAGKAVSDASEAARLAKLAWDAEVKDKREKLRAIVG